MKRLIIIICFTLFTGSLFAQNFFFIDLGPKAGFNTTKLTTNIRDYVPDIKKGWQGGLFLRVGIKNLYFQPEIFLSVKKTGLNFDYGSFDPSNPTSLDPVSQSLNLTTVDVPLLLGYKLINIRLANLRIFGGPVASYSLNKDLQLSVRGFDESNRFSTSEFKDVTWGFKIGAGMDLLIATVDVSYQWGIDKFYQIRDIPEMLGSANIFYVTVGWKIL
jgi:hypothetical protein